jgi:hypothetical protein
LEGMYGLPLAVLRSPEKHQPGMEQPRNVGVRLLADLPSRDERFEGLSHVWFLDTDVIPDPDALASFAHAEFATEVWRCPECGHIEIGPDETESSECPACFTVNANDEGDTWEPVDVVQVGPYDWLPPGKREPMPELKNDPRWPSFDSHKPTDVLTSDLSAGLACFSGNLVWPIDAFQRIGGFWDELHHGRCEDGELGLRAVGMGLGISYVADARGWHLHHDRNVEWIEQTNAIDVPKLNARHPWKELGYGHDELFVVDQEGKRFDCRCGDCGRSFPSAEIWQHKATCNGRV